MGTSFVGKVRDVRWIAEVQIGEGVADKAQVNGHEATEKANRIQAWQILSDWQLADRFDKDRPVLLLLGSWWSGQNEPEFWSAGWWQKPNVQGAGSSRSLVRTFTRCNWVEVASA